MKKYFLALVILFGVQTGKCNVDSLGTVLVTIPDARFLGYLKEKIPEAFTGDKMDINSEAVKTLTRINVINKKIVSFAGIEYFTGLEEFNCTYNLAASLDLSRNTRLKYLVCWENRLTRLDLSGNPELLELNCGDNNITTLNISQNKVLKHLYCEYNRLSALDLAYNRELVTLYCQHNSLTRLDLSQNTKLTRLEVVENPLVSVTKNPILVEIPDPEFRKSLRALIPNAFAGDLLNIRHTNVRALKELNVAARGIKSLEGIAFFTGLEKLDCKDNHITVLSLPSNINLTGIDFENNPLVHMDIRGMRHRSYLSDLSLLSSLKELKLHSKLREIPEVSALKKKQPVKISVYGAAYKSADYILINSDDIPHTADNKYRNNS